MLRGSEQDEALRAKSCVSVRLFFDMPMTGRTLKFFHSLYSRDVLSSNAGGVSLRALGASATRRIL